MTAPSSMPVITGIVQGVATVDPRAWGILRGRRSAKSLWILPELWKRADAFPTSSLDAQTRPQAPQGILIVF